jgi:hypothetical protein
MPDDISGEPGFDPSQHCTTEEECYTFSHTAAYCGRPQPRRCGCAFCYPESGELVQIDEDGAGNPIWGYV